MSGACGGEQLSGVIEASGTLAESRAEMEAKLNRDIEMLRSPEGYLYAGIPCFKGLYGRDGLISGWQLLKRDITIARNTLRFLAKYQGKTNNSRTEEEPGKILHVLILTS